ncbi:hypothetical protein HYPSUDRAFT_210343, partial [Hypholoma sublateritium FD-334 SS-4]
ALHLELFRAQALHLEALHLKRGSSGHRLFISRNRLFRAQALHLKLFRAQALHLKLFREQALHLKLFLPQTLIAQAVKANTLHEDSRQSGLL